MGYFIAIGNAVPFFDKEDGNLNATWRIDTCSNDDAPVFPGDEVTGNTNTRFPSYSG